MAQFSDPHLAALAVLCIATVAAVAIARRHPGVPTGAIARSLAVVILAAWAGEYVTDAIDGTWNARYTLPLQLTDAVSLAAATALVTRRRLAVELTYLWSLSASLQATLTPDLARSFPSVYYFTYFGYHIGAIVAGCMLVFGCGLYPRRRAWLRVFGVTILWAAGAGIADLITGANYMYLRFRPRHDSLLAVLGPWPWYILGGALIGLAMMLILQRLADAIARRDPRALSSDRAVR
ncbi:MAG: TIGR02206 family membrane protein [Solirubrobacteraceae bacterium]